LNYWIVRGHRQIWGIQEKIKIILSCEDISTQKGRGQYGMIVACMWLAKGVEVNGVGICIKRGEVKKGSMYGCVGGNGSQDLWGLTRCEKLREVSRLVLIQVKIWLQKIYTKMLIFDMRNVVGVCSFYLWIASRNFCLIIISLWHVYTSITSPRNQQCE
jgi:hypothetical protein